MYSLLVYCHIMPFKSSDGPHWAFHTAQPRLRQSIWCLAHCGAEASAHHSIDCKRYCKIFPCGHNSILLSAIMCIGGDFMNLLVEVSICMFFIAILATAFVIFILPFLMHVSLLIIKFLLTVVYIIRTVILWLCRLFTHWLLWISS